MADFMICFFMCNVFISGIIGLLLLVKRLFKNILTSRMQYNLWFLLLGSLAVPFLPFHLTGFPQILSWITSLRNSPLPDTGLTMSDVSGRTISGNIDWMNDFTLSVNSRAPSVAGYILLGIWLIGIFAMILLVIKSSVRLRHLRQSALPLQNAKVHRLYQQCLKEMKIKRSIPVYSTVFLKSPIIVGFLRPCIYLPIHLISDYKESDMRYMLLHELQHYRHKDAVVSFWMNLAGVIYWFNPFVWYSLKEMRNDREVACDTSVLKMLNEDIYEDYGNTLINFAEKVSLTPFPFAAGLSGNMKQMKRRIINIASYKKPSIQKKIRSSIAFGMTSVLLLCLAPILSIYAADESHYEWDTSTKNLSYIDLSPSFGEFDGSFVLYDLESDYWTIYNMENATMRVAPDSTYKIYNALFGLEDGVISPENSLITWDGENYPFELWNTNQNLQSAMQNSVNWYFQSLDEQLGYSRVSRYIQDLGFGNENMSGDFSSYWMESSLKISPVEQVELLKKLHSNKLNFTPENMEAVKDSLLISSSENGTLYGKTGTGRVNGQDINGWFIGYIERNGHTNIFATNIQNNQYTTGNKASDITLSILSDMNIWK